MKRNEFNSVYERLLKPDGRQVFEEYVQYCGWFFLQCTDNQLKKIIDILISWDYPVTLDLAKNRNKVTLPNGTALSWPAFEDNR